MTTFRRLLFIGLPLIVAALLTFAIVRSSNHSADAWTRRTVAYSSLAASLIAGRRLSRRP